MDKFSEVLERGGLGYKFLVSADVTMKNEHDCQLSFTVNALNKEKALKEAYQILVDADYIHIVHKLHEPVKKN